MDPMKYYDNYHGHTHHQLTETLKHLHKDGKKKFIYLAGDSSLDNKFWLASYKKPCNGYETFVIASKPDICYQLNRKLVDLNYNNWAVINTAVEESSLGERSKTLLMQDKFICDNISKNDILIVSVGGNDIALKSSMSLKFHIANLIYFAGDIEKSSSFAVLVDLFKTQTESYLNRLTAKCKPRKILISSIYFPCLHGKGWADTVLSLMNYNQNYKRVHEIIKSVYNQATSKVHVEGTKVHVIDTFNILDFANGDDYVARVEPSENGGEKMASSFLKRLGFNKK